MKRILAVSPHLDDAVFSAGGTLAQHALAGDAVMVLTCFSGNVANPQGFALACQIDKGLAPDIDYMALRRAEDEGACVEIGAAVLHWDFLEAPHRGYESASALFGDRLPKDDIAVRLAERLLAVFDHFKPDLCYGPYGIGEHIDHRAVREALERCEPPCPLILWEDFPYAMREGAPPPDLRRWKISGEPARRKRSAILNYRTQLDFQFGSHDQAKATLAAWNHEGFAEPA